jgi:hypothetical protein
MEQDRSIESKKRMIVDICEGHFIVPPNLYRKIPLNSHVCYFRQELDEKMPKEDRFVSGGYVTDTYNNREGDILLKIRNRLDGKDGDTGFREYVVNLKNVAEIWKRYPAESFIESIRRKKSIGLLSK